jgi:hypothetical protein
MIGKPTLLAGIFALTFIFSPASAGSLDDLVAKPWTTLGCSSPEVAAAEAAGLDAFTHTFVDPTDPELSVSVELLCAPRADQQTSAALNDCPATSYNLAPWKWRVPFNVRIDAWNPNGIPSALVLSAFTASAQTWDVQVADELAGAFTLGGSRSSIGTHDWRNQFGWKDLDSGTIALTTTWYYTSNGTAVESDAGYNTDYSWAATGLDPLSMDVQNIATHEIGHTFGMDHSSDDLLSSCLTMYPTGFEGEITKRTLGEGDKDGIQARYPF